MSSCWHLPDQGETEGNEGIGGGPFQAGIFSPPECLAILSSPANQHLPTKLLYPKAAAVLETQAAKTAALVQLSSETAADSFVIGEVTLQFINNTSPQRAQAAENQKAVRSHAARQSHHRRWLQKYGTTGSERKSEGARQVALRQRSVLQMQCECAVNARLLSNGAGLAASPTYNLIALTGLESLRSTPEETRFRNMVPLSSLPARNNAAAVRRQLMAASTAATAVESRNLTPSSLDSDWDAFGLPFEQCSRCGRQLPSLGFRHQQSRQECTNNPVLALGSGHADPFASLPIEIHPYMWPLLDHCK
jgi:hypothetical protein